MTNSGIINDNRGDVPEKVICPATNDYLNINKCIEYNTEKKYRDCYNCSIGREVMAGVL